ncbi:MAG TPA: HAD family hydrolase [Arcobacter sp.]|nr:HAD family hydrolase [Arcobacter sp.]
MKLIIFDMDGTLIDSGNVITNTINYVRSNLGLESIDKNTMLEQLNNPDINSAEFFYGTSEFTDKQTELFTKYYDENCVNDIKLYDGIEELLKELKKDYILSVATNASQEFAKKMLDFLDISKYFNYVVGANMVSSPKPSPDMLLNTLEVLKVKKENAILIGDSQKDARAAKNSNMDFILVNWGFSEEDKDGASSIEELKEKIKGNK